MLSLLCSKTPAELSFVDSSIKCSTKETLLGVLIDSEIRFDEPISIICTKLCMNEIRSHC